MNPEIDRYLSAGCGRCPLGGTPECKVHDWQQELKLLRKIALDSGLKEELKWKVPCYTLNGSNICIVSAFKEHVWISFFQGALLKDSFKILKKPGENSQATRVIKFSSVKEIRQLESTVKDYLKEAIELGRSGAKVELKAKDQLEIPEELERRLSELPALRSAWDRLTPGRRRGYVIFIAAAKQSQTREARIDKWIPAIFEGRGMQD